MNASNQVGAVVLDGAPSRATSGWRTVLFVTAIYALVLTWVVGFEPQGLNASGRGNDPAALLWVLTSAAGGALLAFWVCMMWLESEAATRHLAASLEQRAPRTLLAPFAEFGPPAVVRLIRAINASAKRDAERRAEYLNVQAEFAHDMRGPLARIALRCERLPEGDLRSKIERDLSELNSLVESSLVFARTLHGAREPMQRIDVDGLIQSLAGDYEDAGSTIEVVGRIGRPMMTCPRALRRVLANLIDNALRYGGGARLSARAEARQVVLAVLDDGPGVEQAQLEAIFSPWYRAPSTREHTAGSGLGLAIARRLALSIQGELHARNRADGGFEAALTLPLDKPSERDCICVRGP